jgi:hypothetical protein
MLEDEHRRRAVQLNLRLFDKLELTNTIDVIEQLAHGRAASTRGLNGRLARPLELEQRNA